MDSLYMELRIISLIVLLLASGALPGYVGALLPETIVVILNPGVLALNLLQSPVLKHLLELSLAGRHHLLGSVSIFQ